MAAVSPPPPPEPETSNGTIRHPQKCVPPFYIRLDVGGCKYTTTLATLLRHRESMLARMFSGLDADDVDDDIGDDVDEEVDEDDNDDVEVKKRFNTTRKQ